jgi:WGR domain
MSEACTMTALHLRRIDPARNMCRFYRLDIQPDLFGRILLMKQWGRVGTQGRISPPPCSDTRSARGGGDMRLAAGVRTRKKHNI